MDNERDSNPIVDPDRNPLPTISKRVAKPLNRLNPVGIPLQTSQIQLVCFLTWET